MMKCDMEAVKMETDFKTIPLTEIKQMLGYAGEGYRSVLKWCREKGVVVLGKGLNRRVLAADWWRANKQEFVKGLMALYPDSWRTKLRERGLVLTEHEEVMFNRQYMPKSPAAKSFREGLT